MQVLSILKDQQGFSTPQILHLSPSCRSSKISHHLCLFFLKRDTNDSVGLNWDHRHQSCHVWRKDVIAALRCRVLTLEMFSGALIWHQLVKSSLKRHVMRLYHKIFRGNNRCSFVNQVHLFCRSPVLIYFIRTYCSKYELPKWFPKRWHIWKVWVFLICSFSFQVRLCCKSRQAMLTIPHMETVPG